MTKATIVNYVPFIRSFLNNRLGDGPVTLSRLCARDVVAICTAPGAAFTQAASVMTTALRSFLKYARYRGEVTLDLAAAVPTVANWSMSSIPRAIPTDQVHQLLVSINPQTAIGRRDYAILLLLARLGLRSSEVAFLTRGHRLECRHVEVRGKSGLRNEFPYLLRLVRR